MTEGSEYTYSIDETIDYETWYFKNYIQSTQKENLLNRRTPMIQLFKSDFDTTLNYLVYLTIKAKRDDKKGRHIEIVKH